MARSTTGEQGCRSQAARVERSEIRDRRSSSPTAPGFHFVQSGYKAALHPGHGLPVNEGAGAELGKQFEQHGVRHLAVED
ncbi:MAG TPA: hypothetical protein VFH41_05690, partial [Bradyrhizobium sp.]|nr:hypothetical protein [Bradyrhizobium sp.]